MTANVQTLDGEAGGSRRQRRVHDFLLATLIGLSWFLLARGSFWVARGLALSGYLPNPRWGPLLSSTMLLLGLVAYVPIGLLAASGARRDVGRLVALGVCPSSMSMAVRGILLVVAAVVFSGPRPVWNHLAAHFEGGLLNMLGGIQAPVVEEFVIRGIVWAVLARSFSIGVALTWSTVLFWTWHWEAFGLQGSAINMVWAVLACCLPRIATGMIWPGVFFHLLGAAKYGQFLVPPVALSSAVLIWVDRRKRRAA